MTSYRRIRAQGATYFFTVALADRRSSLLVDQISALRAAYHKTRSERPFCCDAFVVLPDHLHAIWTLPTGDADYSTRWRLIKTRFVRQVGGLGVRSTSKRSKQERGIWQRRFWEHCIRNDTDFATHMSYCWGNPVKHGLVKRAADWPYSSIHRDIRAGKIDAELAGYCLDSRQL